MGGINNVLENIRTNGGQILNSIFRPGYAIATAVAGDTLE